MEGNSQIKEFFKNQTIFLTGGSGFLGKIIIEKLLRECQDLKTIYVLIRARKNKSSEERFRELFSYRCFDCLKSINPELLRKVSLMSGDCQKPFLGLGKQNLEILKNETTCVIHAAANVKFDQGLKEATLNVRSTKDLLEMAKQMPSLKVFVYVSTAYSNCVNSHIKEQFYEPPTKAENLIALVDSFSDDIIEAITPKLLGNWPNTYVYTKCVSEDLVRSFSTDLPITVVRPAIVCSTIEEPIRGWIDNFYGAIGIVTAAGLGVLRSIHIKKNNWAPLVPVDYVSNCVLSAARKRAQSNTTIIYNYVGPRKSRLTWYKFMKLIESHRWNVASDKVLWHYMFEMRENRLWHKTCVFFMHTVVAYLVDFVLMCVGKPVLAVEGYRRLDKMLDLASIFTTRNWEFDDDNVVALWKEMSDDDKKIFSFHTENFNWNRYILDCVLGIRLHMLKDTIDTVPKGRRKLMIMFVAHYTVLTLLLYLLYKLISFIVNLAW